MKNKKSKKTFFVYDGRANHDIDSALVLDCFDAKDDSQAKRLYIQKGWKEVDSVLVDHENNIVW